MKRIHSFVWLPILLGVLTPTLSGCRGLDRALGPDAPEVRPDPNPPPLDAYALSGGKITHYTPTPGLPSDPAAKALLMACRQVKVDAHSARSAFVVITAGQYGKFPLNALVVGSKVLVLPTDLATMGIESSGTPAQFSLYPISATTVVFTAGSRTASVGSERIKLSMPVVAVDYQSVTTLSDLLRVFRERDRQRHQSPFIRSARIIYNLRDE